ncbi:GntR family transcriptional regulator [Kerstersia gyiorum]|uniref:GntR family transcriptional regulator n=1 Tax=Kerstersia gyiorum TaxID=206506 RepID=A0A171KP27_9BURK|nr:GntR family transcriptional regulator [Kerstersia gyiorum]AZV92709.1 GntR family transcriptional regulator [Bordetella sp. J329]MCO7637909.1 GntR family transcriptional regulator [Pseudomonas sp. S 311-6]KAB0542291.1 GntR family transcriptional regulator [Kerstersia gyiorum]KKO70644.1 GntR family transcriptional regulator [Kerstersia gyiorum]MCH4270959.1 GntR family transcriptional regulator [Kerstersia gyiorum]
MDSQQSRVLVQLRDMILKGEFVPGERLAEVPLAEKLGASRTPVRLALTSLEHEGLIESAPGGGYRMRQFTAREIADAIRLRGLIEGFAARLLAEQGAPRQLLRELQECLDDGDRVVYKAQMDLDDYAAYVEMNDRFHRLILEGCGNVMLTRMLELLVGQPFAAPSAMLPMQSNMEEGQQWMQHAHRTHHAIFQAIERGQGYRAQALGEEHVEIARMNLEYALEKPELAVELMPSMRLVDTKGRL